MKTIIAIMLTMALLCTACAKSPAAPAWQEQYDLGVRYLSEGNYQEAVIAFTAAIEIDPKRADAYLSLADAYIATGDTEAAGDVLRRGFEETEDARLRQRLEELPRSEQTGQAERPGSDEPPEELTVLVKESVYEREVEDGVYLDARLVNTYTFEYNENGYMVYGRIESPWSFGDLHVTEIIYEYDEATGSWYHTYLDEFSHEAPSKTKIEHRRGVAQRMMSNRSVCIAPYSYAWGGEDTFGATTIWNPHAADDESAGGEGNWAYAEYEYDAAGNTERIVSYAESGEITGYCLLEWAVLKRGPDGTYTMQSGGSQ